MTLICRRSFETNSHVANPTERMLRAHSSVKLDENCLSRFRVLVHSDGSVSATYYNHHTGHDPQTDQFNVFRLGRSVLQTIDSMILTGVPAQRIVKDLNAALRDRDSRDAAFIVRFPQVIRIFSKFYRWDLPFRPPTAQCL
jgi:hypothetical protein